MRSLFSLENIVVVSSLAIIGLFTIRSLAMDDTTDPLDNDITSYPICNKKSKSNINQPEVLLVSTLDGKLTAIDPANDGKTLWSVGTGN